MPEIYQWTPTPSGLYCGGYSLIHNVYVHMVISFIGQVANHVMKYNNMRIAKMR